MKKLLALAAACVSLCAADTNTNNLAIFQIVVPEPTPYTFDTPTTLGMDYRTIWKNSGSNICELNLVTNVVTQWMPIEQEEGQPFSRVKQVGALITNQVLTVIAYGKTNEVLLKQLGREEWPSQKRTVMVPNQHAQQRK